MRSAEELDCRKNLSLVTKRVDGFVYLADSELKALKHNSIIHLHIGTQNTVTKLAVWMEKKFCPDILVSFNLSPQRLCFHFETTSS